MAFVRLVRDLMRDKGIGKRVVPIIPDEARTFGMDSFFPTAKIYNPHGQHYTAVDRDLLLAYKESRQGQILHTASTRRARWPPSPPPAPLRHPRRADDPGLRLLLDVRFQRTGDAMWAAMGPDGPRLHHRRHRRPDHADRRGSAARRRPLAAAGRRRTRRCASTTRRTGTRSPTSSRPGCEQMYGAATPTDRELHVLPTVYNEPIQQPAEPEDVDVEGILKGMHRISSRPVTRSQVQLLASGVVGAVGAGGRGCAGRGLGGPARTSGRSTSWTELRRDGLAAEEHNFLHPDEEPRVPYVTEKLSGRRGADRSPHRLRCRRCRTRSGSSCRTRSPPWARTATGSPTPGAAARRYFHIDIALDRGARAAGARRPPVRSTAALAREAADKYRCWTSTPAPPATRAANPEEPDRRGDPPQLRATDAAAEWSSACARTR